MMRRCLFAVLLFATCLIGCSQYVYQHTSTGTFKGKLDVRWIEPDRFIYVPNTEDPMRFTTSQNKVIRPDKMYTDGGSIPRLFWSVPGYSPWGYAPAYIIHDWLFEAHHCELSEYKDVSFEDSARDLAEGIKTLMENGIAPRDETTLWAIYEAVLSPIAKAAWERPNACDRPKEVLFSPGRAAPGTLLFTIDMSDIPNDRRHYQR
jgi:Protein of unknown function (DUF1353)